MIVLGERHDERKDAGRAVMREILTLVQLQQEGEAQLGSLGGFDVVYEGERFGRDGYHYRTVLQRTGANYEIDLPVTVTPLGAISRLEHALDDFEGERYRHRQQLEDARRRLASYRAHETGTFAFADELAAKRRELEEVEEALAAEARATADPASQAA